MNKVFLIATTLLFLAVGIKGQSVFEFTSAASEKDWPTELPWWKRNNLRVMQTNLPDYEAKLDVDHLINSLQRFSVNTLIINAGGIMAYYPTTLDYQYTNPHMQEDMLQDVIRKCHDLDIRVVCRFDFSRVHKSIFEGHPDWCYISKKGTRIINDDMYMVSFNAPYVQEKSIEIINEVINNYPIDGIFINMPGYRTNNAYKGTYSGIDQNVYDKRRFKEYSGQDEFPTSENSDDPVFKEYQQFKSYTEDEWMKNIHQAVKSKDPNIAICTYQEKYVDIIRHESQTRDTPYWPYMSFDNVTNTMTSQPNHIVSNASIQQISFRSRFNAIEPEETAIRLYENIAGGSGLDMSMMGDFKDYEDERNFSTWEKIYGHHKKHEAYYGKYNSQARICVISNSYWPSGQQAEEYRGIQLMLKEDHIQYDIINHHEILNLKEHIAERYDVIIIPQIPSLSDAAIEGLTYAYKNGSHIIATNQTMMHNEEALERIFGTSIIDAENEAEGNYLLIENTQIFKRLSNQKLISTNFNLGLYDFSKTDQSFLPITTPGRPGPPEKTGGHTPTGHYAIGVKNHPQSKAILMPLNIGRSYYLTGYQQYKNVFLDILETVFPKSSRLIETNAHERVEVIIQNFSKNLPENIGKTKIDGTILHLVNLTGFSSNTYFEPLTIHNIQFKLTSQFKPQSMYSMAQEKEIPFTWENGCIKFKLSQLDQYDGLIIE